MSWPIGIFPRLVTRLCGIALILVVSGSCLPASPELLAARESPPPPATQADVDTGEIYLLLSSLQPPFTYRLMRAPFACLRSQINCDSARLVPQFPEEYGQTSRIPLQWSRGGEWALLTSGYDPRPVLYDPATENLLALASSEEKLLSSQVAWRPGFNQVVAVIEGDDPFASDLILLDVVENTIERIAPGLAGILYPVAWQDSATLILLQVNYEAPPDAASDKRDIASQNLMRLSIEDGSHEVIMADMPLRGGSLPSLSPDGQSLAAAVVRDEQAFLELYSLRGEVLHSFGPYLDPRWSLQGDRLAAIDQDGQETALVILDPVTGAEQSFPAPALIEIIWLPGGGEILLVLENADTGGISLAVWLLADEKMIDLGLNDLVGNQFFLAGLSIRPH